MRVFKKVIIGEITVGILLLVGLSIAGLFFPTVRDDAKRFTKIADKRMPAVVHIVVPHTEGAVQGAGVLITNRGHILTASHLFTNEQVIPSVTGHTGEIYPAEVIHSHPGDDIALIKINAFTPQFAPLARFGSVRIGHEVVAIGHPLGLDWSVTHGIISQIKAGDMYAQFNQTDTAVNPGSSGGPVFNLKGEVIGIVSHSYSASMFPVNVGLNTAVSIDAIHVFLEKFKGL